jgi:DNA polymerase
MTNSSTSAETSPEGFSASQLIDILRFHTENGTDSCVSEEPVDQFSLSQNNPTAASSAKPEIPKELYRKAEKPIEAPAPQLAIIPKATIPDAEAIQAAEAAVRDVSSLEALRSAIKEFPHCSLSKSASSCVLGAGNAQSGIVILGDFPGQDDDRTGDAFSGAEGRLLDAMLKAIDLERGEIYLGMAVPWRPPGGISMSPLASAICAIFLRRHLQLAAPKNILCFGHTAARLLKDPKAKETTGIMQMRGKPLDLKDYGLEGAMLPTLSPKYLLQQPAHKRFAWADLQQFKAML